MTMAKVYLVVAQTGEYSDTRTYQLKVFSTRDKAAAFVSEIRAGLDEVQTAYAQFRNTYPLGSRNRDEAAVSFNDNHNGTVIVPLVQRFIKSFGFHPDRGDAELWISEMEME